MYVLWSLILFIAYFIFYAYGGYIVVLVLSFALFLPMGFFVI